MSRMRHKLNFKGCLTSLNSDFSFSLNGCHTKVKNPSRSYYLSIAGGTVGFIYFPMVFVLWGNKNSLLQDLKSSH